MKRIYAMVVLLAVTVFALQAKAYDTLAEDFQLCTQGDSSVSNSSIVEACTRLIDNAQAENETIGLIHAIRGSLSTDRARNCQDARTASRLVKDPNLQSQLSGLVADNC